MVAVCYLFSSGRDNTRYVEVSWARRCVYETPHTHTHTHTHYIHTHTLYHILWHPCWQMKMSINIHQLQPNRRSEAGPLATMCLPASEDTVPTTRHNRQNYSRHVNSMIVSVIQNALNTISSMKCTSTFNMCCSVIQITLNKICSIKFTTTLACG